MEPHIAQKSPYASPVEAGKASRRQAFMCCGPQGAGINTAP